LQAVSCQKQHAGDALVKISFLFYEPIATLAELDRRMARLAALGYQGVELSARHPPDYPVAEIMALSRKHRLPVVSFLSGWSYANERLCLSSPDDGVRDRAVGRLIDYVGEAAALGAVLVVGLMQGLRSDEPDEISANERIADCLGPVAREAARRGVRVVLEPVNHLQVGFNHTAGEAAAMVARVGSPGLGYMLDTIHMNIEERSLLDTIRSHGPKIGHFHLCETNGGPFGSGNLDFPRVLAALRDSGYDRYASVKIYRKVASWEEAARSAAEFLGRCGVSFARD
jgi:sugar phosphate isomerase/epimerase